MTLHPRAARHGILARRDVPADVADLQQHGIYPIDLVCVNLPVRADDRPPGRDVEDAIEQIDVGGPAMLRAAAKNHAHVIPVCRPQDYEPVLGELRSSGNVSTSTRRALAAQAFATTAAYDAAVAGFLGGDEPFPESVVAAFERVAELSYGENPHQRAAYYAQRGTRTHLLARVEQLHGARSPSTT